VIGATRQVLTIHDLSVYDFPSGFNSTYRAVYRTLYSVLPRRVRRLITVSEFTRRRIIDLFGLPPERVGVVPNAPSPHFRPLGAESVEPTLRRLGVGRPYVFALGAISARKNFVRLLQAWERIKGRWPDHRLVVVGTAGLQFADRGGLGRLPERAILLDHLPDDDLVVLYNGADVLAYPSLYEGFGLPVIEAMACGTPVLTSDTSSMPEIAGEAALLVDPWSVDAIASGLETLLSDAGLRDELSARGLARAADFSWERSASLLSVELARL
jgi:glycosyltransferase involved in cell wall biosynthesis